jgi:hypothetical protein
MLSDADEAPIEKLGAVRHYFHQLRSRAIGPSDSFFFFFFKLTARKNKS